MKALVVYHKGQEKKILSHLRSLFTVEAVEREKACAPQYVDKQLVIVIGGDGTFLRANHHNKEVPMFGINADPEHKEGFFMQADVHDYKDKVGKLLDGFDTMDLLRLKVSIDGEELEEYVLNDVYIGDAKPYNMFNYVVRLEEEEFQRSSGMLIGTAAGSHAWLSSAGGQRLAMGEQKFQFLARELYEGRLVKDYRFRQGILDKDESISLVAKSPGIVVIDSISREYKVKREEIVGIYVSEPLPYIKVE